MVRIIIHFTNFEQDHPKSGSYLHLAVEYENLDVFKTVFEAAKNKFPTNGEEKNPYDTANGNFKQEFF